MKSADEALSREVERGMTREHLLRRAAALGIVVAGGTFGPLTEAAFASTQIKRGGTFRIGISGGAANDFIDGQHIVNEPDIARLVANYEGLAYFDENYKPKIDGLAEELRAEKANQWLIRVRDGVEFHNGKTLTADDVIYSIRRTINHPLKIFGQVGLSVIDSRRIKKLDKRTVRLFLKRPDVTLIDSFSQYFQGVVPVGYPAKELGSRSKSPLRYIGTGAFKIQSFTPGRQSVHVRNENYWRTGQPYFDRLVLIDFPDDAARVNALLGGQIDALVDLPAAQVSVINRRKNLKVYEVPQGGWTPITMAIDQPPFTDVRVRQAFRLLANRPQMVRQGLGGHGRVANDIYSPFDLSYAGDEFPQRRYDPERAKSLLKAAGQENITIDCFTNPADVGMVEGAEIFAQTARAGGVTVNVRNIPDFYGDQYLKYTFATDFWSTRNYLQQVAVGSLKESAFNETHWDKHPRYGRFLALYRQALATVDLKKRSDIIREMQRMEYNEGGHIVWAFKNAIDAHSKRVGGFKTDRGTLSLNKYGNNFRTIYFV